MENQKLAFHLGKKIKFLEQNEVMYCVSDSNYCGITATDGRKVLTSKTLKELEKIFDLNTFIRVHHSCIINIQHVASFSNENENALEMNDGKQLHVSRRRKKQFLSMFHRL
jgi:two-component system LytT family response regulator